LGIFCKQWFLNTFDKFPANLFGIFIVQELILYPFVAFGFGAFFFFGTTGV
jgi:hypothetical protein